MTTAPHRQRNVTRNASWQKPTLRHLLQRSNTFVTCLELVTSRGTITERSGRRVLELARELAQHPRVHALSITDNPGGNAMLSADTLGTDLIARGQEVIIHLSCKDWNRNALQSRAWELASAGFQNILALSGDYPVSGYAGQASAVFDIDSVGLLQMFCDMNRGLEVLPRRGRPATRMQPTRFYLGTVVNNFKLQEREVMPQYFKLAKKIESGAQFVINQLGYDSRKQHELLKYMAMRGLNVPVLANVYVLSAPAARFFHSGAIPGCMVTDQLLDLCQRHAQSADKGKAYFLEFAAKQVAIAKGLGFRGAYLGGHLHCDDYLRIFEIADSFGPNDWTTFAREIQFNRKGEFYFFEQDPQTGLASDQVNRVYLASTTSDGRRALRKRVPLSYKLSRIAHAKIFEKGSAGFAVGKRIYAKVDKTHGLRAVAHRAELALKVLSFDCKDCGDCSLPDAAYLCPESQCVKNQRNGPCGGTRDGACEVGEKQCIWTLAYDRLKGYGEEERMLDGPVIYKDAALKGTSAWTNTFLERDHHANENAAVQHSADAPTSARRCDQKRPHLR